MIPGGISLWIGSTVSDGTFTPTSLDGEEKSATLARLEQARRMFGGTEALPHFRSWKSPEER